MSQRNYALNPEFCLKTLVKKWLDTYKEGDFLSVLKDHWRTFVFAAIQHDDPAKVDRLVQKYMFYPMECFLSNGQDPETFLTQLKERDKPSQLCGHVFKIGEPNYSCRDCATDATCVLCMECFETSVHKLEKHRYKINSSSGGGYCDCGDTEAWKTEPFCRKHKPQIDHDADSNPMEELPDDLIDRASALFLSTLKYTVELLTWDQSDSLPAGLELEGELEDEYFCMLFNDEVHTYEQVINVLQRSVNCDHQRAVELAMTVDRMGRCPVLYGKFEECERARNKIERNTARHGKALKVQVMHTSVVTHQLFALRMMSWFQAIVSMSDGLKRLFCLLSMQAQENEKSLMEVLLLADTQLWKAARMLSHELMMTGIQLSLSELQVLLLLSLATDHFAIAKAMGLFVLMDQECKRRFSVLFTKHYCKLMKDFFQDDHDHDVSVACLTVQIFTVVSLCYNSVTKDFVQDDHYRTASVTKITAQIYTVPSLARYLISEHNLLSVILKTFLQYCDEKKNKEGHIHFDRTITTAFKRAWYCLSDLKYALICMPGPGEWTDALRKSFLEGFSDFLQILKLMEGMDAVTRQTGQHLEFEPDWEGAFHLQIKLEDSMALMLEWCGSDKVVLMEAYNKALEVLDSCKNVDVNKKESFTVAGHSAKCIIYDVSSQPISIHLPVTRIIAGLHTYLGIQGLKFESPDCRLVRPDPMTLIELPLRVKVLVAQFRANMWRRNGYALINQIMFYHNVRCRSQMHDKDINMLQAGASLCNKTECNNYIIHLLFKYGLTVWIREEYDSPTGQEDSLRQTISLAEEFLELLINIISERFVLGIGAIKKEDIVKREVIHHLCISPMAHSELAKALHEDHNNETGLELIIKDIAKFKMQGGKGKYELNPDCYAEYNPFFYHYSKSEKSKSEEAQIKRQKENNETLALPPPVPPKFTPDYQPIINLLQCDVMIYIIELVLTRTLASRSRSWSEMQLERVLHLIGIALHEQKRAMETGNQDFDFVSRASKPFKDSAKGKKDGKSIQVLLESIINAQNISHDSTRELVVWTHKLMTEVHQLKNNTTSIESVEQMTSPKDEKAEAMRKKKAAAAEKRRQKIMAQMSQMQKNFIKQNSELFENTNSELLPRSNSEMDLSEAPGSSNSTFPVAVGPKKTPFVQGSPVLGNCILCQEEEEVSLTGKTYVLTGFVQRSTVLAMTHGNALLHGDEHDPLFMMSDLNTGTHTSSCGHMMHAECWQGYFDNILTRDRRRPVRFRHIHSYDVERLEFLCPLCQCLSNTVIPVIPQISPPQTSSPEKDVPLSYSTWLSCIHKAVMNSVVEPDEMDASDDSVSYQPCSLSSVTSSMEGSVAQSFQSLWSQDQSSTPDSLSAEMREMIRKYSRDTYTFGLSVDPDDENARVPVMGWSTCAYTIQSMEQLLRDEGKSVFGHLSSRQNDCLRAVVKSVALNGATNNPDVTKEHCIRLLFFLFPDVLKVKKADKMCVLDIDMFHYLTSLVMALPSLYIDSDTPTSVFALPRGGANDQYALQLVLAVHLVQILLLFDEDNCGMEVDGEYEGEALLILYDKLHSLANIRRDNQPLPWQLTVHVRRAMLPFLRCSALLFHYLTGISPPYDLSGVVANHDDFDGVCKSLGDEFESLCRYLGVNSHMSRLLDNQGELMDTLISRWCKNTALKEKLSASSIPPVQYPLSINHLVPLPDDFSELINRVSTFTCPRSDGDDSRTPTMCLVCGKILCSQSYCCQTQFDGVSMGAATEHTYRCGAGIGIFLRVRECQILLQAGRHKGCFVPPPYIDDYGETDQGLRRGNALHFCKESYDQLQKIWMSHSIPETIAHSLESNNSLFGIDWQQL